VKRGGKEVSIGFGFAVARPIECTMLVRVSRRIVLTRFIQPFVFFFFFSSSSFVIRPDPIHATIREMISSVHSIAMVEMGLAADHSIFIRHEVGFDGLVVDWF
jgi:hypothetical protein